MSDKKATDAIIDALMGVKYGLKPFDPKRDKPKDVGLGGPSTEYLEGAPDPDGREFLYPRIWWANGQPQMLSSDEAYAQALKYEALTGKTFPRFDNPWAASFAAQNRSAMGGAEKTPITSPWWQGTQK